MMPIISVKRLQPRVLSRNFARSARMSFAARSQLSASAQPHDVSDVKVSQLPNGLRVVSLQDQYTPFSSLGVYARAGSRYESHDSLCASQFAASLAFKDSATMPNASDVLAKLGGSMAAMTTRENIVFQGSVLGEHMPDAMRLVAETAVWRPDYTEAEVAAGRDNIAFAVSETLKTPALYVREYLFNIAFGRSGLGLSQNTLLSHQDVSHSMTPEKLKLYARRNLQPSRMVFAYVGIAPHEAVHELAEHHFSETKSVNDKEEKNDHRETSEDKTKSSSPSISGDCYVGGSHVYLIPPPPLAHPNETRKLTYIQLAFRAPSCLETADSITMHCLQYLLGGGDAFSSGGPGKGMYSRLFTNVLNRSSSIESCVAFYEPMLDCGLFGIQASCGPELNGRIFQIVAAELLRVAHGQIHREELQRTKNQLKSNMMIALESQLMRTENLGVQILTRNSYTSPQEVSRMIDAVTVEDIKRLATQMMSSNLGTCVVNSECPEGLPCLDTELKRLHGI